MTALYVLAQEHRALAERLADLDIDAQTLADTLEGEAGAFEQKAVAVAMVSRNFDATAQAIKEAEAAMAARRKAIENRAASLRSYLLNCMQATGIKKIDCPHFTLAVRDNPPAVDVFDAAQLPAEYMRQPEPPSPDKTAIKEALKMGKEVPGARLTQGQRLEIK
jgi:Siphovirus Gp157